MARLKEKYLKEVGPQLKEKFGYSNMMQVPKLEKIVLSIGLGEAVRDPKTLESAEKDLTAISGQKPVVTGKEIHRLIQVESRYAHWSDGHVAWYSNVRFSG